MKTALNKATKATTATKAPAAGRKPAKAARAEPAIPRVPSHLGGGSPHEEAVTEFEQSLICAAEAFYRFIGLLLGEDGRLAKLTGQDNVILQQLMSSPRPRGVLELSRFANRDDIANIQYSLRKLIKSGLVEKAPGSTNRDTAYQVTARGQALTRGFLQMRRDLLMSPSAQIPGLDGRVREAAQVLSLLTSFYDSGTRQLSRREAAHLAPRS